MAIEEYAFSTRLQLKLLTGFDEEGKEIFRTKTYSKMCIRDSNRSWRPGYYVWNSHK